MSIESYSNRESIEKMKRAKVISGFPGIGKSTLFENNRALEFLDSDSTNFSWADESKETRNQDWPQNYMEHIVESAKYADAIFVSTHDTVRNALIESRVPFVLVYPSLEMKEEYIQRYKDRGNDEKFVKLLEANYKVWIENLMSQEGCKHVVLQPGQYLSDVIGEIL